MHWACSRVGHEFAKDGKRASGEDTKEARKVEKDGLKKLEKKVW